MHYSYFSYTWLQKILTKTRIYSVTPSLWMLLLTFFVDKFKVTVHLPGSVLQAALWHSRSVGESGKEKRGFLQVDPGVVVPGQYDWMHGKHTRDK